MSENVVLQVEGLCFAYPECGVLNQWSVALPAGLALVRGDESSGKTTLLRLLAGELTAQAGRITLQGVSLGDAPQAFSHLVFWGAPRGQQAQGGRGGGAGLGRAADLERRACGRAGQAVGHLPGPRPGAGGGPARAGGGRGALRGFARRALGHGGGTERLSGVRGTERLRLPPPLVLDWAAIGCFPVL